MAKSKKKRRQTDVINPSIESGSLQLQKLLVPSEPEAVPPSILKLLGKYNSVDACLWIFHIIGVITRTACSAVGDCVASFTCTHQQPHADTGVESRLFLPLDGILTANLSTGQVVLVSHSSLRQLLSAYHTQL